MKDVWGIKKKDTRDTEGLRKMKSDVSKAVEWGRRKYDEKTDYKTIKVEKENLEDVIKFMKKKGIKFFL